MKFLFCAKFLSQIHDWTNDALNSSCYATTSKQTTQRTETVVIAEQCTAEMNFCLNVLNMWSSGAAHFSCHTALFKLNIVKVWCVLCHS